MNKSIKFDAPVQRAALLVAIFICLIGAYFFAKWCFATTVAARAPQKEIAEFAVSIAPDDPQTHYALAVTEERTFLAEDLSASLSEFGQATALSPYDFRLWLAYGRALERNGEAAKAEQALKKASELAPNYPQVQWALGNVLIRAGKTEEGFSEIRRAAENDPNFRLPTITTAWQIFDGNINDIKQFLGDSINLNSGLMVFLLNQKRLDEALLIWRTLPAETKKNAAIADREQLFNSLIATKNYRHALEVQKDISEPTEIGKFAVGQIYNGGFETELAREKAALFDWQISDGMQPQIGPNDEQKRSGNRSIFIIFNSNDGKDFRSISQTIVVEPNRKYVFNGFYKSNLKTAATVRWEVVDASSSEVLATTAPISSVAADWTALSVSFNSKTEAVTVRLAREQCKSIICPIAGNIWFDDFSIQ